MLTFSVFHRLWWRKLTITDHAPITNQVKFHVFISLLSFDLKISVKNFLSLLFVKKTLELISQGQFTKVKSKPISIPATKKNLLRNRQMSSHFDLPIPRKLLAFTNNNIYHLVWKPKSNSLLMSDILKNTFTEMSAESVCNSQIFKTWV